MADATRDLWLAARRADDTGQVLIGGSDAAALLGWNPLMDPLLLYVVKQGRADEPASDEAAEAGRFMEPAILRWYAHRTGRVVISAAEVAEHLRDLDEVSDTERIGLGLACAEALAPFVRVRFAAGDHVIFQSRQKPWLAMSVDAFAYDPELGWGIVDAKNLAQSKAIEWHDGIPPAKAPQIVHYTMITPFTWGGFAVVFGGNRLRAYDVRREAMGGMHGLLEIAIERFLECMRTGTPPEPAATKAGAAALAVMYPTDETKVVGWVSAQEMDDDTVWDPHDFGACWDATSEALKAANGDRAAQKAVVLAVARGAGEVVMPDGSAFIIGQRGIRRRRS